MRDTSQSAECWFSERSRSVAVVGSGSGVSH